VLYFDSRDEGFWLEDAEISELAQIVEGAVRAMDGVEGAHLGRIRNFALGRVCSSPISDAETDTNTDALEMLSLIEPPSTTDQFVLNYDHTDLAPVSTKSTTTVSKEPSNAR
jgi:hypothetical protein